MRAARRRLAVDMSTSSAARAVATTARPTAHAHAHTVSTAPANTSAAAGTTDAPFPVIGAAFTGLSVAALLLLCCVAYCLRPPRKPQAPHGEGHGGGGGGGGQPPEPAGGGAHGDAEHVRVVRLAASDLSQHASSVLGGGGATVAAGSPRPWTRGHNADMSDHVTRQRRPGSLSEMDVALPPATPVAMPTPRHRNESCDSVTLFALPGGWEEVETEHGDTFYVDHNDKQTTWERPASAARVVSDRGDTSATRRPSHPATRRVGFFSAAAAAVKAGTRWKAHTRSAAQVGPINDDVTVAVSVTPEPDAVFEAAASTVVAVAWDHAGTPVRYAQVRDSLVEDPLGRTPANIDADQTAADAAGDAEGTTTALTAPKPTAEEGLAPATPATPATPPIHAGAPAAPDPPAAEPELAELLDPAEHGGNTAAAGDGCAPLVKLQA